MVAWVPLESNPDTMNLFLQQSGVPTNWKIHDVYSLDKEMLSLIPKPVAAVILLFPVNKELGEGGDSTIKNVFFMKQLIGNACGTIALLHAVSNSPVQLNDGLLKTFFEANKDKTPQERGASLMDDSEVAKDLAQIHETCAREGQTAAPDADTPIPLHFVAIVQKDGLLYELDGRKEGPVQHGKTTDETFLQDAANVCKKFIDSLPDALNFNVMALSAAE